MGLEPSELARWTRFAAKGGIGKCTATCDCVAKSIDDLMFLKDDEITVLLQLPDKENLFLGYCEGVVGHFSGSDVHFHAKLKVPVKAKRASTISGKSPPPSSDTTSPVGQSSRRSSSTSKTDQEALDRRTSQQRRVQIPSRIQSVEDEQQRHPPSLTFSGSSPGTDSLVTTPALGYFSSPEMIKSSIYSTPASSPRDPHFSIEAPYSFSMPSTRASSPPSMSPSHLHTSMMSTVQQKNTHTRLTPESITPLRINKRAPTSPSVPQFSPNLNQSSSQPPLSSSVPDTSHSTHDERSARQVVETSDAQAVGLSLLQDLTNGMDSESDDDDDHRLKQYSPAAGTPDLDSYAAALNRVGHRRDSPSEGTQESTVEGLGYAISTEDDYEAEVAGRGKYAVIIEDTPSQTTSAVTTRRASPNPSICSNSNANAGRNASLPSPISPSISEWEGASDIYDDYRYSRHSMASKMSRISSSAGWTGSISVTPPLPDSNSIGRARTDSTKSRPDSYARSRTDSMNTRSNADSSSISSETKVGSGGSQLSSLPLLPETSDSGGQEVQGLKQQLKRMTIMKERTMSMESADSVYTQNSCFSQDAIPLTSGSNADNQFHTSFTSSNTDMNDPGAFKTRPTPLPLSQSDIVNSPLLHTTWDTSLSVAIDDSFTGSSAGSEHWDLQTPRVDIVSGGVRTVLGSTEEGRRKESDTPTTGSFSHGINGVGIASALRHRLETERCSPMLDEQSQDQRLVRNASERKRFLQSDGLGHGIVVEDDDELPSRVLDDSAYTTASPEPMYDEEENDDSIEDGRSAGVNAGAGDEDAPSPSILMGDSYVVRGSRGTEDEDEEQEQEQGLEEVPNPTIPIELPLNESSSTPPLSASSSSPHFPRLSSASTIRVDSPPIDFRPPLALSDIREPGGPLVPGSNQRQSLFLPHPNAPKAIGDVCSFPATGLVGPGPGVPMYIAAQEREGRARGQMVLPASPDVIGVIRIALNAPPRPLIPPPTQGGPPGQRAPMMLPMRGPTIYGRTEFDLTASLVPVPIVFSINPPPNVPLAPYPSLAPPQDASTSKPAMPSSPAQPHHASRSMSLGGASAVSASAGPSAGEGDVNTAEPKATGGIPRPNFSPKSAGLRPRSRSFSSFNSTSTEVPQQSGDEAGTPSGTDMKRSLTTSISSPSNLNLSISSPFGSSKRKLASIRLSPLSLPPNNPRLSALRSPNSPLAQSVVPPVPVSPNHLSIGTGSRSQHQLRREPSSRSPLNETVPSPSRSISNPRPIIPGSIDSSPPPSSPPQSVGHASSLHAHSQSRNDASRGSEADAVSINSDTRCPARQLSLRTKLSLPNLRRHRSRQEDEPTAVAGSGGDGGEMLQVKDTEFQLVTPNFAHFQSSSRASDDSGVLGKDAEVRQDGNAAFLRTESPAVSMLSGGSKQSPLSEVPRSWSPLSISNPATRDTAAESSSMEAHRNRETKWMTQMSSNPASQARKSKKVRKLIVDGVPSSVRYLVWSYLTDGKARCVPGVYAQLCSRGRVPSSDDIEKDIKGCFQDQPHLQGTQGPVLSLLQAYLNMVPDIMYSMGLTLIVGQLLLLAPEEDAFWIFISIMDTHIRPYFSTVTTQMEVDAALFSRALENNDGQVARKILVDMGITPPTICQPWFSSLFVGTLPPEYLNRVWDLFLFEGIPFLLRVALAIVTCCRATILESASEEKALEIFQHPPISLLPPTADAFLSLVCSVKLKDDDMRKQRIKMEAQVKRQTQVPRTVSTVGGISLPRT